MLFNSVHFLVFFPVVLLVVFRLPPTQRVPFLLAASYYFYGIWKPAYLVLLVASTLLDYGVGLALGREDRPAARRLLLGCSLGGNLGMLFFFKYYNFFARSVHTLLDWTPVASALPMSDFVLPVGISFYTFQTLSYAVDVYRRRIPPERNLAALALYVAYFPQLVAGPIERATNLLPQIRHTRPLDATRYVSGLRMVLWGLFKKMVIADNLAPVVDFVYYRHALLPGPALVLGTVLFAYQIFCDFSGYSDIAIGTARMLGVDLMCNFDRPYWSRSVPEFWRRWHISLSTWFRDYVYVPLGGNRVSPTRRLVNLFVVFLLSGLWHGASWTYVAWGALHGLYMVSSVVTEPLRCRVRSVLRLERSPSLHAFLQRATTFVLVNVGWVLFRSESVGVARDILSGFALGWTDVSAWRLVRDGIVLRFPVEIAIAVLMLPIVELVHAQGRSLAPDVLPVPLLGFSRWVAYYLLTAAVLLFGNWGTPSAFIYFQF